MTDSVCYVTTRTGERIGYDMCFAAECLQPLSRCRCDGGPTPPRFGRRREAGEVAAAPAERAAA